MIDVPGGSQNQVRSHNGLFYWAERVRECTTQSNSGRFCDRKSLVVLIGLSSGSDAGRNELKIDFFSPDVVLSLPRLEATRVRVIPVEARLPVA